MQQRAVGRLVLVAAFVLLAATRGARGAADKTVLAWVEGNWSEVAEFVLGGSAKGAVNAVSAGGMWGVSPVDGSLTIDAAKEDEHRRVWQSARARDAGLRTYPVVGFGGNITVLRTMFEHGQDDFVREISRKVLDLDVDGVNIDFEPLADVHDRDAAGAPTPEDGAAFASFLDALTRAVHALPGRTRIVSMDSESIVGACWSTPPVPSHTWDYKPCPWIRNFWDFNRIERTALDRVIPMDTYTQNSTEFPYSLWYYQKYFPISRLGFGVWPTKTVNTDAFAASRVGAFEKFGADWISAWVINPGTKECPTWRDVEERWSPWIPHFRRFLSSGEA